MKTTLIIIGLFIGILAIGFVKVLRVSKKLIEKYNFAAKFRKKFMKMAKKYFETFEKFSRSGDLDGEKYTWLTKNVNRIQTELGMTGIMHYKAAFNLYQIPNYEIVSNTLPKFRDGSVEPPDVNATDDSILRYLGQLEPILDKKKKQFWNPLIWFREGIKEILSFPLYLLNWFGLINMRQLQDFKEGRIWTIITGIGGLVTFLSGIVTILQGKEYLKELIESIFS